jgi:hypothetical protein
MKAHHSIPSLSTVKQAQIGLRVASGVFGFVSIGHLLRFWSGWDLQIAGRPVGLTTSLIVVLVCAGLSLWLWKLAVVLGRPPGPRSH